MPENTCVLSIIVPVYNMEKYLRDCLDSLLMQDLSEDEYEIICVDDGSKDSSPAILDEYAENHSNIRVIHKQNGGVSSARNVGIEAAKGDYLWFVDSDDCIAFNCLGVLKSILSEYRPVSLKIGYQLVDDVYDIHACSNVCCNYEYEIHEQYTIETKASVVCELILQRSILLNLQMQFPKGIKYSEDSIFMLEWFAKTDGVWGQIRNRIYMYRQNTLSAMHIQTPDSMIARLKSAEHNVDIAKCLLENVHEQYKIQGIKDFIWWTNYLRLSVLPRTNIDKNTELKKMRLEGGYPLPLNSRFLNKQKTFAGKLHELIKGMVLFLPPLYGIYYIVIKNRYQRQLKKQ